MVDVFSLLLGDNANNRSYLQSFPHIPFNITFGKMIERTLIEAAAMIAAKNKTLKT